ncbi:ankyrin repeat-containing domain protein [Xylogone sp. PMI_703]|nr:ankyrin repeat-containing domain protein [Xylogone sp. PMI_703]
MHSFGEAVRTGPVADVAHYIEDHNPRHTNKYGYTHLMQASKRGVPEIVKLLVEDGAIVDAKSDDGETAFLLAVQNDHADVAAYLQSRGASVDSPTTVGTIALHFAASNNDVIIMDIILLNGGASSVNKKTDRGNTALHFAAQRGAIEAINTLLAFGAIKTLKNSDGKTPRDEANRSGFPAAAAIL